MANSIALCTLYEGDYHYGLGALANSLHASGFDGTLWVGTRGERPPWVDGDTKSLPNGLNIRFQTLETPYHFSHYKPWFMQDVFGLSGADRVAYFDPDIVVKASWDFFTDWTSHGIALVGDYFEDMGEDHLFRKHWREHAKNRGLSESRQLSRYFNAGFIAICKADIDFLHGWQELLAGLPDLGIAIDKLLPASKLHPFQMTDQDLMNANLECGLWPLATLPASAMDFKNQIGSVMCHMTPGAKPWRCGYFLGTKKFRERGHFSRQYWANARAPIQLYSRPELRLRLLDQKLASLFGKIYSNPWWQS